MVQEPPVKKPRMSEEERAVQLRDQGDTETVLAHKLQAMRLRCKARTRATALLGRLYRVFHITPGNRPPVATEVEVVESALLTFIGEGPAFAGEDAMGDDAEFVAYWWSQLVVSLQEARSGRSVDASSRSSTTGSAGSTCRTMPGDRGTFIDEDDLDLQEDERRLADIMERVWSTRSPTRADVHHVLDSREVLDQACQLAEAPECEDADRHQKALRAAAALQRDENDTMARAMTTSVHWQMPHDEVRVTLQGFVTNITGAASSSGQTMQWHLRPGEGLQLRLGVEQRRLPPQGSDDDQQGQGKATTVKADTKGF